MRPTVTGQVDQSGLVRQFRATCPGVAVTAIPAVDAPVHPTMGPFVSVWTAWATDPAVRFTGSSGGVLTALSCWLLQTGAVHPVVGAASSIVRPVRTVALELRNRDQVMSAAGSRYAPVANAELFRPADSVSAFVGNLVKCSLPGR